MVSFSCALIALFFPFMAHVTILTVLFREGTLFGWPAPSAAAVGCSAGVVGILGSCLFEAVG
ncbi:hypothetical protein HOY80DRAFT_988177 [Tuber brumale]|nr:hypothetical protein HOY80DRAFT_988177 [Tuber brumale]